MEPSFFNNRKWLFWALLFSSIGILFHHAHQEGFFLDGYTYAVLGKNIAASGNGLVPFYTKFIHARFHDHVPFVFVLEALFFKAFGVSYLSARVFIGLFSLALVLGIFIYLQHLQFYSQAFLASFWLLASFPFLKQSRFPNPDIPLTFFSLFSLYAFYEALRSGHRRYWFVASLCLSFAMFSKGPMAVFVPITWWVYLFSLRDWKTLSSFRFWFALIGAASLFCVWPALLFYTHNEDIWFGYLNHTFLYSIKESRGLIHNELGLYLKYLLWYCAPQVVLGAFAIFRFFSSQRRDNFIRLNIIFVGVVLSLCSVMKFKYSHYIMPVYPSLAFLAACGMIELKDWNWNKLLLPITIVVSLILVAIPMTFLNQRDEELLTIIKKLKTENINSKLDWINLRDAYGFWEISGLVAFELGTTVYPSEEKRISFVLANTLKTHRAILVMKDSENIDSSSLRIVESLGRYTKKHIKAYIVEIIPDPF